MGCAPEEQRPPSGLLANDKQDYKLQRSQPPAPQNHCYPSRMETNGRHELRHPAPNFMQYRQYLAHLDTATGPDYRQAPPSVSTVHPQYNVSGGPRQATRVSASTASTASASHVGTHHHQRSVNQTVPQDAAGRQSYVSSGTDYSRNVKPAAAPENMAVPTLALPNLHRVRVGHHSQNTPWSAMATPVSTPQPRAPCVYNAEPPTSSTSTADILQRQTMTEGLKRLETLERTLDALSRRANATDRGQSSTLAGLDRRLSDLEQTFAEQQRVKGLNSPLHVAKAERSGSPYEALAQQENRQKLEQPAPDVDEKQKWTEITPRRDGPMVSDGGTWKRNKESRTDVRKRYDLRKRAARRI